MGDEFQPPPTPPTPATVTEDGPPQEVPPAVEAFNLVDDLMATPDGAEWLKKEAARVVKRCEEDQDSRSAFMKRRARQLKLLAGVIDKMKFPAEGAETPHIPMLLQAAISHWSRIWDQVIPSKGDIVHMFATSFEDEERARRVEKHFNWQLRVKVPNYASGHATSIMQWMSGSCFRVYCWDPIEKCHRIEAVPMDDIVVCYTERDDDPLMQNVPVKTYIRRLPRHTLEAWEKVGYYVGIAELFETSKAGQKDDDESPIRAAIKKIDGVDPSDSYASQEKSPDATREIYEQHYWTSIPGTDGIKPVKFAVDKLSKKPLSLTIREMENSVDRSRYEREKGEYDAAVASWQQHMQMDPSAGLPEPVKPAQPKIDTLNTIIHYRCFPNPEGFYGLGPISLLEGPNTLVDNLLGDLMVAGKFQNVQSGFISERARGKKGDVEFVPGKFHALDCEPEELDKAVKPFQFGQPSATLMEIAKWQVEEAKNQTASADTLAGEQGTSRETAASVRTRNSNAAQVINVMTRLYLVPFTSELRLIMHGNSIYLDDVEYFNVVEPSQKTPGQSQVFRGQVARDDYLEDYEISPTADARMSSKPERISEAFGLLDRVQQSAVMRDPQRGPMLLYVAMKNAFTAIERPDFLAALGPPPEPAPPPSPQSQETENAGFLNEQDHPVFPDDDHALHLRTINDFRMDPHYGYLSPTGKQLLDRHERAHAAALYQQQGAMNGQGAAQGMGAQPGGAGGIPAGRGNGPGPGGLVRPAQGPAA